MADRGRMGVYLFFILSGFLLSQRWFAADYAGRAAPSYRAYLRLRLFRIVPAYYVCLFLVLIFLVPTLIAPARVYSIAGLTDIVSHLFFLQTVVPWSVSSFTADVPMWTLSTEMTFYLLLPFAARLFVRSRWMLSLPICALVALAWAHEARIHTGPSLLLSGYVNQLPWGGDFFTPAWAQDYLSWFFPAHVFGFALGMTLANLSIRLSRRPASAARHARLWKSLVAVAAVLVGTVILGLVVYQTPTGLALVVTPGQHAAADIQAQLAYSTTGSVGDYFETVSSLGFAFIVGGALLGAGPLRAVLSSAPLRLGGIISYSVYLWHYPLLRLVTTYPDFLSLSTVARWERLLVMLACGVIPLSLASYLAVERPFILYARRRRDKPAAVTHTPRQAPDWREAIADAPTRPMPGVGALETVDAQTTARIAVPLPPIERARHGPAGSTR